MWNYLSFLNSPWVPSVPWVLIFQKDPSKKKHVKLTEHTHWRYGHLSWRRTERQCLHVTPLWPDKYMYLNLAQPFLPGSFHIYYFTPQGAKEVQALEVKRCTGQPTHPSSLLAIGAGESWESQRTLEDKSSLLDQCHLERLLFLCLLL